MQNSRDIPVQKMPMLSKRQSHLPQLYIEIYLDIISLLLYHMYMYLKETPTNLSLYLNLRLRLTKSSNNLHLIWANTTATNENNC